MEIEVTQEKLNKALGVVSRVAAGARASLPILSNVLIRAEGNKVTLTATNLDMAVVDYVPVVKATDGVAAIPARLIADFVGNLPKGEKITIRADGVKVKISAGKYTSTINGSQPDDFPELPEIDEKSAVIYRMGVDEFKNGIGEVIVATSNDTTLPSLTGVYFNTADGALYIAATDRYRLTERKFISKVESEVMAIVPTASLQEVVRSIPDDADEVEMLFDETQVRFRLGELEITSKLIDGTFPDYRQLVPENTAIEAVVDRAELSRIVKIAALFAKEANGAITVETNKEKKILIVSSISNEVGENKSELDADVTEDGEVKLDSRFLIDALNVLEEKKIKFGFSTKVAPILIRNEKNKNYRHVIMPLDN